MCAVVYAEKSEGDNPGHMVVGQEPPQGAIAHYGYRFDPANLPPEAGPPECWRDYLFTHHCPGDIVDEKSYVRHLLNVVGLTYFHLRAECDVDKVIESFLPPREQWRSYARYSFNPDDHHSEGKPCFNCVTWATMIANHLSPGMIQPVRQGRVKLILLQLKFALNEEAVDG